ncbi:hypothetical protein SUGI_0644710 [Cryptomeria japonica]|nr:hypothetical protein SUGI_0644710 [Cryptomeria japonica]
MAVHLSVPELHRLAFLQQTRNSAYELQSQALLVRDQILGIEKFISKEQAGIDKLLNYYGVILGAIFCAIYGVQIVERKNHCAVWWTAPVLAAIASVGIIATIALKIYNQFTLFVNQQILFQQLNMLVDVNGIET